MDNPFETSALLYDQWYDDFPNIFQSEVFALRALLPPPGTWAEIGVGTGRFAAELGIRLGVEPAEGMASLARQRGIDVIRGKAETLPFDTASFDAIFFISTLCSVQDLQLSLNEAFRVLRPTGCCVIGLLPSDSPLGEAIQAQSTDDPFFKHAHLRSKSEVFNALDAAGFSIERTAQTLLGSPADFGACVPSQEAGHDRGSFVVLRAAKTANEAVSSKPSADQHTFPVSSA